MGKKRRKKETVATSTVLKTPLITEPSTPEPETAEQITVVADEFPTEIVWHAWPDWPEFVGWRYSAQQIEDFREAYINFCAEYDRLRHKR